MSWPVRIDFTAAEQHALRVAAEFRTAAEPAEHEAQRATLARALQSAPSLHRTFTDLVAIVRESGAVIVAGTPLDDGVLIAVSSLLGPVTAEGNGSPPGRLVYDLISGPESGYDPEALPLHTDSVFEARPHPFIGLAAVRPGADGDGLTTLARADRVAARIEAIHPRHLELLHDSCFPFAKIRDGAAEVRTRAILTGAGTEVAAVFHGRHLREGMSLRPEAVDGEHRTALGTLESVLDDPGTATTVALRTQDLLLTDNRRVLHGRTAVRSEDATRHVKRLKMTD
ncbi:TauD/TfdA dioxygenase family protein [Nocardia sp. NPDC088792]|uniref:TauD/TfdA dioxygenase family protein n=1 Tax=Nocardia sp. NPDC088792 TaxID=3364332 RepID=UPI00381A1E97